MAGLIYNLVFKFRRYVYWLAECEPLCFSLYIGAVMYDMFYLDLQPPSKNSLSSLGRRKYYLFFFYWFLTGNGLLLNVQRAFNRLAYTGFYAHFLLYTGYFLIYPMIVIMSPKRFWHVIHIIFAVSLAVCQFISLAWALCVNLKYRRIRYLAIGMIFSICIDVYHLLVYHQQALYAFLPVLLAFMVCGFVNYTDYYSINKKDDDPTKGHKPTKENPFPEAPMVIKKIDVKPDSELTFFEKLLDPIAGIITVVGFFSIFMFKYFD